MLWLVQPQQFLVTNIYVRDETAATASQRIWHFCQACSESDKLFYQRLDEFRGKHLRVRLETISPSRSGADKHYSDVDRFLRPRLPLDESALADYREATTSQPSAASDAQKGIADMFAV